MSRQTRSVTRSTTEVLPAGSQRNLPAPPHQGPSILPDIYKEMLVDVSPIRMEPSFSLISASYAGQGKISKIRRRTIPNYG